MSVPWGISRRRVLRRKLRVPAAWQGAVRRSHLHGLLDSAMDTGQHACVVAGSGYGKTTLLAQWAAERQERGQPVAWLSLDAGDADLGTFAAHLAGAFECSLEGFHTGASDLLGTVQEQDGANAAIAALLDDLDEQCGQPAGQPAVLVFEDFHLAESPVLAAQLARILRFLPPTVRVVVSSRALPAIELPALAAKRQMMVLTEADLAFTAAEVLEFRPALSPAEAERLVLETGGWPLGVGLPRGDLDACLDAYLDETLSGQQSGEARAFLLRSALVDSFAAEECETAFGIPLGPELRQILLRQRHIRPVDDGRFEVPPPLRGVLRRRFAADLPARERAAAVELLGDHLWATGMELGAIRFWVDHQISNRAAERLADVAERWLDEGRFNALHSAVDMLGAHGRLPALLLAKGELLRRLGLFEQAAASLEEALGSPEGWSDGEAPIRGILRLAQVESSRGRTQRAKDLLAGLADRIPPGTRFQAESLNLGGTVLLLEGDATQAAAAFEASHRLCRRLAHPYGAAKAAHNLGVCYTRLGELRRALQAYDLAMEDSPADAPLLWMTPINRALVLAYLGRLPEARSASEDALHIVRRFKLTREEGFALRTLGYVLSRMGDLASALGCHEEAERIARRASDSAGLAFSLNFQADVAILLGDAAAASRLIGEAETAIGGEAFSRNPEFGLVQARQFLANGQPKQACDLAGACLAEAEARGYRAACAQFKALVARARLALGDAVGAEALEAQARTAAENAGLDLRSIAPELWRSAQAHPGPAIEAVPDAGDLLPEADLTVLCLGGVKILWGGIAAPERDWQGVKTKLLLAYLLHQPDGATKGQLQEALYGGEQMSESSLAMNVLRLRKALEPDIEKGQPSRFIRRSDGRYFFNRQSRTVVDTQVFEAAARPSAHEPEQLRRALRLYRGDFLPEFEAGWVAAYRQMLRDKALAVCRKLLSAVENDPEESRMVIARALEIDPLAEDFHREVILRFIETEEPHRALEHYRLCEARYRELLDMDPPGDLRHLVEPLRRTR